MPSIGIVYGAESGIVRRVIVPDHDKQLRYVELQPGEAMVAVDRIKFDNGVVDVNDATAAVEEFRGKPSQNPRCVVVNKNGDVIGAVMADPLIDVDPKGELIRHPEAGVGWKKLGKDLTDQRPVAEPGRRPAETI